MFTNINPMNKSTAILEILIMLLVAAILGFILAWLIFRNKNNTVYNSSEDINSEIEKLKKKNNDFLIELGNVKRSNTDLSIKLDECNKRGAAAKKSTSTSVSSPTPIPTPTPVVMTPVVSEVSNQKPDDLKIIEGIGPKIESLLNNAGIFTFSQLAEAKTDFLKDILVNAGTRFQMHDPSTWAAQSALARDGKFDQLKKLQDELNAGRA